MPCSVGRPSAGPAKASRPRRASAAAACWLLALCPACATTPAAPHGSAVGEKAAPPALGRVLEAARDHLGKTTVNVGGKPFRYDCSGFVRGAYSAAGVDLMGLGTQHPDDNGVLLIHRYLERYGENHQRKVPSVGDVIYFDNTWDKNGDGKLNDPLTHIGLVEAADEDGTVHIIHRANRGIVRDEMNLLHPHQTHGAGKKPWNSFLRPKGKHDPQELPQLTAELWAGFGTLGRAPQAESFPELPGAAEDPRAILAAVDGWR
jgi:hypothetical protein